MLHVKHLQDLSLSGQRVLVRGDLNVPIEKGEVTDTRRLEALLPTLRLVRSHNAKIVLLSHFGRPEGIDSRYSLEQVIPAFQRLLPEASWAFCPLPPGKEALQWLDDHPAEITVLENLRFWPGEVANDPEFAKDLASLGDAVVQDALSICHRDHASVTTLSTLLPSAVGCFLHQELQGLSKVFEEPKRPLMALVGGAKVSTKLPVLENLVEKADILAVGGAMAHTFLAAKGYPIGGSLYEPSLIKTAEKILQIAEERGVTLLLPVDGVVATKLEPNAPTRIAFLGDGETSQTPPPTATEQILDVGPQTLTLWAEELAACHSVVWNGPLGAFETQPFDQGTTQIAQTIASLTQYHDLQSIAGGGDTLAAIRRAGVDGQFTYLCTAGGAFLEWLEGKTLPGLKALEPVFSN